MARVLCLDRLVPSITRRRAQQRRPVDTRVALLIDDEPRAGEVTGRRSDGVEPTVASHKGEHGGDLGSEAVGRGDRRIAITQ